MGVRYMDMVMERHARARRHGIQRARYHIPLYGFSYVLETLRSRSPVACSSLKMNIELIRNAFQPSLSLWAAGDVIVTSGQPNGNAIPPDVDPLRAVAARRTANHNSYDSCQ